MSSIISALSAQQTPAPAAAAPGAPPTDQLTSRDTFLKLLVAQIKNQDPTNPTDATQFVGQLTQYSELEQLINISQGVQKLTAQPAPPLKTPTL